MKHFIITSTAWLFFLGSLSLAQAPPEQMVPLPQFAEEQAELSAHVSELEEAIGGSQREGATYENGQMIRYRAAAHDTRVFTTSLPIETVREKYLKLMLSGMEDEGMPPEAITQYRDFLESEVVQPVMTDAILAGDTKMIAQHYAQAGIDLPEGYLDCLRRLEPELEGKEGASFSIEMDERRFRQEDPVHPGGYFTIVEVEAHTPYPNTLDCEILEETTIIYKSYRMQLLEDE